MATPAGHSTASLVLSAGMGLASGVYIGYRLFSRPASGPSLHDIAPLAASTATRQAAADGAPPRSARAAAPAALASHPIGLRLAVLVRQDIELPAWRLVEHAAWTVLGMWKKLYKRGDASLLAWDRGGARLEVLGAPTEDDLLLVQSAARSLALPTHTFAGRDPSKKERSVMVVGPAPDDALSEITSHLRQYPG